MGIRRTRHICISCVDNSFEHALYIIENSVRYHQCSVCMHEAYHILLISCFRAHQPHAKAVEACKRLLGVSKAEGRAYPGHNLSATLLHIDVSVCKYTHDRICNS